MIKFYRFILLILFAVAYNKPLFAQNVSLTETKGNRTQKKFKKILLIGAGSTATRLFLDNLTQNLIAEFNKKNIQAQYYYDGKLARNAQINFLSLTNDNYDGYIVFNLSDTSFVKQKNNQFQLNIPIYSGTQVVPININYNKLRYAEEFLIEFFEYENIKTPIWEGILKVNFDFSKIKNYNNIVDLLLKNFTKNKLL